jgi:hypothetical protein
MFDAVPEKFNEDIVECAPLSIHVDYDAFMYQHTNEGSAGER